MTQIITSLFLLLALLLPLPCAAELYTQMPPLLRFSQSSAQETLPGGATVRRTYPDTASDAVDDALRGVVDGLAAGGLPALAQAGADAVLDVGALVSRSGESALSFLTLAELSRDRQLLRVDFDARVYDAATGARVQLVDLFGEDSGAYALLAEQAKSALAAAFPGLVPDAQALDALCAPEAIRCAPFTLGAARLSLVFRADALYPGKSTLLHVNVGYSRLRSFMTPYGLSLTDNARFPMLALTFDDGPVRGSTRGVLDALRDYGAQATFFVVGERLANGRDLLARQQNGNYSVQSHSYTHRYPDEMKRDEPFAEKARMEAALGEIIGVVPVMMRAPGGHAVYYARREIGYPMIQWTLASGDSGNPHVSKIARKVIVSADDGEIVLLHDLNGGCPTYTRQILDALTEQGFLFVTVQELFEDAGVPLEPNVVYKSPTVLEYGIQD